MSITIWSHFPQYRVPDELYHNAPPAPYWADYIRSSPEQVQEHEREWVERMRELCITFGKGPIRGEVISFDVGPGPTGEAQPRAEYMVYSTHPTILFWLRTPINRPSALDATRLRALTADEVKRRVLIGKHIDQIRERVAKRAAKT